MYTPVNSSFALYIKVGYTTLQGLIIAECEDLSRRRIIVAFRDFQEIVLIKDRARLLPEMRGLSRRPILVAFRDFADTVLSFTEWQAIWTG